MLAEFLATNSDEIVRRTRAKVALRSPPPSEDELKNGVPVFLRQLIDRLSLASTDNGAIEASATRHGAELQRMGFSVGQVVHDYGDVCQAVTELAEATNAPITTNEFHTLNRCLDDAIAHAVTEYGQERERSIADDRTERLGSFAHELGNQLGTAILSFNILKKGNVALGGSTGALLGRSLRGLRDLVTESLAELRLESGAQRPQRVSVFDTLGDAEIDASLDANARGLQLTVARGERGVDVLVDRHILTAAVGGLLQYALKLTPSGGRVALRATATSDRVLIEVLDECAVPLPEDGLAICRRSVAAIGGELRVSIPSGTGRVFTIDLQRQAPP
jgi:signal transduction histidine kinase